MAQEYIFTFGIGMPNAGHYIRIKADDYGAARRAMCELHGSEWAFQYDNDTWEHAEHRAKQLGHRHETQLGETIDVSTPGEPQMDLSAMMRGGTE